VSAEEMLGLITSALAAATATSNNYNIKQLQQLKKTSLYATANSIKNTNEHLV